MILRLMLGPSHRSSQKGLSMASASRDIQNKVSGSCPEDVMCLPAMRPREHLLAVPSALPFILKCRDCAIIHASYSISCTAPTPRYSSLRRPRGPEPTRPDPTPSHASQPDPKRPHPTPLHLTGPDQNSTRPSQPHPIPPHPTPHHLRHPRYLISPALCHHTPPLAMPRHATPPHPLTPITPHPTPPRPSLPAQPQHTTPHPRHPQHAPHPRPATWRHPTPPHVTPPHPTRSTPPHPPPHRTPPAPPHPLS